MCLHDHDQPSPPSALTRRHALAGAAVLAGVAGSSLVPGAAQATGRPGAAPRPPRRPPVVGPLVVEGGTLLDPATGRVTEDAVVVLVDGRVAAVGTRDETRRAVAAAGRRARRVDATGTWVLPGLVDAHVHVNTVADAAALLRAGATTVRSGSSSFYQDVAVRALSTWAPGTAPRMLAAGVFVSPDLGDTVLADPHLAPLAGIEGGVRSTADLRYLTRVNISRGVDVVKTRANPRAGLAEQDPTELVYDREQIAAVVSAAGRADVLCHAYSAEGIDGAVRAGVRSIEHGVFVGERTLDRMAARGTYFTPTMSAITGLAGSDDPVLAERGRAYTPVLQAAVREARERGVTVVAGTDSAGTPIDPIGGEVRLLVEAGVPHLEAVRAATTYAARLLRDDRVGRLVRGSRADLVAVGKDPLAAADALEDVRLVVAQGAVVRDEVGAGAA